MYVCVYIYIYIIVYIFIYIHTHYLVAWTLRVELPRNSPVVQLSLLRFQNTCKRCTLNTSTPNTRNSQAFRDLKGFSVTKELNELSSGIPSVFDQQLHILVTATSSRPPQRANTLTHPYRRPFRCPHKSP